MSQPESDTAVIEAPGCRAQFPILQNVLDAADILRSVWIPGSLTPRKRQPRCRRHMHPFKTTAPQLRRGNELTKTSCLVVRVACQLAKDNAPPCQSEEQGQRVWP